MVKGKSLEITAIDCYLKIVYQRVKRLDLPMWPARYAEFSALPLEYSDPDLKVS